MDLCGKQRKCKQSKKRFISKKNDSLSKVLGQHVLSEQLQCALALILQVCEVYWRDERCFNKIYYMIETTV